MAMSEFCVHSIAQHAFLSGLPYSVPAQREWGSALPAFGVENEASREEQRWHHGKDCVVGEIW